MENERNPFVRAVPTGESASHENKGTVAKAAVPTGGSASPEKKSTVAKAAVPTGGSASPEKKSSVAKVAVPTGATENPEGRSVTAKSAVPTGESANPERKSVTAKAAAPTGGVASPEKKSTVAKAAVPAGATANPEERSVTAKSAVPTGESARPEGKSVTTEAAVPEAAKTYTQHIAGFKGLNRRQTVDSGSLSEAKDISFDNYPYIESAYAAIEMCEFEIIIPDKTDKTVGVSKGIGEIYNVAVRGEEFFIVAENGYIYGKNEDGNVKYIAICERDAAMSQTYPNMSQIYPKQRALFTETVSTESIAGMSISRFLCLYGKLKNFEDNADFRLPVLAVGNIEFVTDFINDLYRNEAYDESRVYAVVPEGKNKATEIWVNGRLDGSAKQWYELRRAIRIGTGTTSGGYVYYKSGLDSWEQSVYIGKDKGINDIDEKLNGASLRRFATADDIYGMYFEGIKDNYTEKKGLFTFVQSTAPQFEHVVWYKNRVFGSVGGYVIASEYNQYNGWRTDTTGSISSAHAWMVTSSANSRAGGDITNLTVYMGRVEALKSDYMQEISGGGNPFNIQDVYAIGTSSARGTAEAYGKLIIASDNNLYYYSGGWPRVFGRETGVDEYKNAVSGGSGAKYYLFCKDEKGEKHLFVYDFVCGVWSERNVPGGEEFVYLGEVGGMFAGLTNDGKMYRFDGGEKRTRSGEWAFETEDMTESSLDLKRIQKIKLYYEIGGGAECAVYTKLSEKRPMKKCYSYKNTSENTERKRGEITLTNAVDYNLKLRFEGSGYFKLLSMEFEIKDGGKITND